MSNWTGAGASILSTPSQGYALQTAMTELKRSLPWLTRSVSFTPIDGLSDGINPVFHLPVVPASGTVPANFYDASGAAHLGATVLDYDTGTVLFSAGSVPTTTVYTSYTAQALSDTKLIDLCKTGFDEMESRYPRNYALVISGGNDYVSSDSAAVTDPVCGSGNFSTSRSQVDFLLACCEYRATQAFYQEAAANAISYREDRVSGLMVDRSKQAAAYKDLITFLEAKLTEKYWTAMTDSGDADLFGQYIPGRQSNEFRATFPLWENSDQANGR
jgi:hypothetical protein